MSRLNIAVIGVGIGGKIHIKSLKSSIQAKLDSIIAPDREFNHQVAKSENVPIFHSIADCVQNRRPDGIIIASPNKFHLEHIKSCNKYGIPALLEKPVTANLAEALELCDLAENGSPKILVGHHRAHSPIIKVAAEIIKSGRLGRTVSVMGSAQFYKPDHYFEDGPWKKLPGGGPLLINMIHEVDNLRRLIGEIAKIQSITSSQVRGFAVEDTAAINLVFQNGVLGTFILSDTAATARSWEQTSGENPAYPSHPEEDCYLISGTRGSLSVPSMQIKYYSDDTKPSWWIPFKEEKISFIKADPIDLQLQHFVEVIKCIACPLVTAKDGYINLMIVEAIKKSASNNSIVDVSVLKFKS